MKRDLACACGVMPPICAVQVASLKCDFACSPLCRWHHRSGTLPALLCAGGIMKCDVMASGIVAAARQVGVNVPLIVRLEGTNVDKGKEILRSSGLAIIAADDLDDAAKKAVASLKK